MTDQLGKVDLGKVEEAYRLLLSAIGEDSTREGLRDTPKRCAQMWKEFVDYDPGTLGTSFESVEAGQLVVVSGMRVWSFCEHHMLPFWADVTIGYIPDQRVLGLSKFGRIAHRYAHRLQIQERLANQIANEIRELSGSRDVAVLVTGEHLCMTMRGVRTPSKMTTSVIHGAFRNESAARDEFLRIALLTK